VTALLAAEDLFKSYGRKSVLRGASFEAHPGQLVAVLGENGAGKSTLLRIVAGADSADRGRVLRRGRLGYCPQEHVLYPYLTIEEHLELFSRAYGLSSKLAQARVDRLAETFDFVRYRKQPVDELSGGTRQKLNLAIALLHDPDVVLLDEPYAGLDLESYRAFMAWADATKREGKCIVLITHLVFEVERLDAVFRLRDGRIHAGAE
jgi:ABC-type multidrug transport system ATPase subunit